MHTRALDSFVLQTLFPLLYLLMKRHYEIMRIMRTKILNMRELLEGVQGIEYINDAVFDRVQDLTRMSVSPSTAACYVNLIIDNFAQQKLDPEKQFQSFAFGIVGYFSFPDLTTF
jgi:hypothetical protein